MRKECALFLLALLISCECIAIAAAADPVSASVTFSLEIASPTLTPVEPGGNGGGGSGGGDGGGTIRPAVPPATVLQPASLPAAPPSGASANPPSLSRPGPSAVAPPSAVAQPALNPLLAPVPILATYASILFALFLCTLTAAYSYTKRDVLSRYRTWITLYLISMTGVLWASFVYTEGGPLPDSIFILTSVAGLNLVVHIFRFDRIRIPIPAVLGYTGAG